MTTGPLIDRRTTLALGLATSLPAGMARAAAGPSLMDDVRHYAALGPHRTGTPGNLATLDWVEARLGEAGFVVQRQSIRYADHDIARAVIATGAVQLEGIVQRPACPTSPAGLSAPLVLADEPVDPTQLSGKIAVIRLPHARHSSILEGRTARPVKAALAAGCVGLVLVTRGPSGEALALNAPLEHPVSAVPTLVIAPRDAGPIIAAAARGDTGRIVLEGQAIIASSANLVARRQGKGRAIIVTTPLSGWFGCAGERGSGIAAFLHVAPLLARRYPAADLHFAGLVGHEREYVGGDAYVGALAPPPDQVRLWVHLGAGFAARDWHEIADGVLAPLPGADAQRYLLAPEAWLGTLRPLLATLPGYQQPYPATIENSAGEARHFIERGYRNMIATIGAHRLHHARTDDASAVDPASLAESWTGWSRALLAVIDRHARN
ncbi:hypothetical protein [Sphingomonas sp.]